jgi:hypothetical protein
MDIDVSFDKSDKRDVLLDVLQKNGPILPLLGREKQIENISKNVLVPYPIKTSVGVLCATRGLGKTTLLKALIHPEAYNVTIDNPQLMSARAVGRLAVVDLNRYKIVLEDEYFAENLWIEIILDHLWILFQGCVVNGIYFKKRLSKTELLIHSVQEAFKKWIDLTNAAYEVNSDARPVILLDEIGVFMGMLNRPSSTKRDVNGNSYNHTFLYEAITNILSRCYVIAAGTRDGNLAALTDYSNFVTTNISLTPFSMHDVYQYGVNYLNWNNCIQQWPKDFDAFLNDSSILSLFYQTLQVPRLVVIALESFKDSPSIVAACSTYEEKIGKWYADASQTFGNFTDDQLVHILFVCATGYRLFLNECIPGTEILIGDLVDGGMIFHYIDDRYTTLLWLFAKERLHDLNKHAKTLIPNINLLKCFFSFDSWNNKSLDLYSIGIEFESIFAHSLCIKYYLHSRVKNQKGPFRFTDVYDIGKCSKSFPAASTWKIDLRGGYVETQEVTHNDDLEPCFYHNILTHTAAADSIVFKERNNHLHIQNKYSMNSEIETSNIAKQLGNCNDLLWVQLGIKEDSYVPPNYRNEEVKKAWNEKRLAFIDGGGCCNPMLMDLLILFKLHLKIYKQE